MNSGTIGEEQGERLYFHPSPVQYRASHGSAVVALLRSCSAIPFIPIRSVVGYHSRKIPISRL